MERTHPWFDRLLALIYGPLPPQGDPALYAWAKPELMNLWLSGGTRRFEDVTQALDDDTCRAVANYGWMLATGWVTRVIERAPGGAEHHVYTITDTGRQVARATPSPVETGGMTFVNTRRR